MRIKLKILLLLLNVSFLLNAQSGSGGEAGAFMKNGFGARAAAMGNAFSAVSDDASALFWNPAGLVDINKIEIMGMYSNLFQDVNDIYYGNFALTIPTNSGVIGFGVVLLEVSDIPYVSDLSGPNGDSFSDKELALLFSFSKRIFDELNAGITLKYLNHSIADYSAGGFGLDLGFQFYLAKSLSLGIMLQDLLGARMKLNNTEDIYPLKLKIGLAYRIIANLLLLSEMRYIDDSSVTFKFGGEYSLFKDILFVRGGYNTLLESWSAGLGISYWEIKIDYSYNSHNELGGINKFGISVHL
jgi:hypothetical protein